MIKRNDIVKLENGELAVVKIVQADALGVRLLDQTTRLIVSPSSVELPPAPLQLAV